jgi:hypothetical protein
LEAIVIQKTKFIRIRWKQADAIYLPKLLTEIAQLSLRIQAVSDHILNLKILCEAYSELEFIHPVELCEWADKSQKPLDELCIGGIRYYPTIFSMVAQSHPQLLEDIEPLNVAMSRELEENGRNEFRMARTFGVDPSAGETCVALMGSETILTSEKLQEWMEQVLSMGRAIERKGQVHDHFFCFIYFRI